MRDCTTTKPAELCHWHVPQAHYLESWSDARAYDGTVGIVQPLIAPLYHGRSLHEVLALLSGDNRKSDHDLVRNYWRGAASAGSPISSSRIYGKRRCTTASWPEPPFLRDRVRSTLDYSKLPPSPAPDRQAN